MSAPIKEGDIVRYVYRVDTDPTEKPNVSSAICTKIHQSPGSSGDEVVDLHVFHSLGFFIALKVKKGHTKERGTWHWDGTPDLPPEEVPIVPPEGE